MKFTERLSVASLLVALGVSRLAQAGGELPSFYRDPGKPEARGTANHSVDEHIDPFTGMLQLHHVDLVIPGNGGFDLTIQRSYNSPTANYGTTSDTTSYNRTPNIGVGWNLLIGGRVFNAVGTGDACTGGGHQMVFETPDGGRQALISKNDGTFGSAARWKAICSGGGVQVWAPNGTRYDMMKALPQTIPGTVQAGTFLYPTRIEDRNGNYATFSYTFLTNVEVLDTIATSDGRTLRFHYQDYGLVYLLSSLDTGHGVFTFEYDPVPAVVDAYGDEVAWFLSQVNPPAGAPWKYLTNSCYVSTPDRCALAGFYYPEGGTIAYTYANVNFNDGSGNTPVVATKAVGGLFTLVGNGQTNTNTTTYTYTPGTSTVNDKTVVQSPVGTTTYEHLGVSSAASGTMWKVGLLAKRTQQSVSGAVLQTETFTWDKQQIAPYPTRRYFGASDPVTYAPLMTQRKLTRNGIDYTTNYSNFDVYGNAQQVDETGPGRSRGTARTFYVDTTRWILNFPKDETISDLGFIGRTYDANGNLTIENRFGVPATTGYYSDGSVSSRTDANSKVTSFGSYYRGVAQVEQRPESVTINRTVDGAGNITSETDGAGHTYGYAYDGLRRMTLKTPPIGNATTIGWSGSSLRTATRSAYVESLQFDGQSNPFILSRSGIETAYAHDALGNKQFETYPGGVTHNADGTLTMFGTQLDVDGMGRVLKATHADATFRSYAHLGASVQQTDERSHLTTYIYEAFGEPDKRFLTAINLPGGNNITIARDGLGNIRTVSQGGLTRTYGYNGAYFLTSIADPETGTTTFGRDAVGNMTSRTVGGRQTLFGYDGLNRLTSVTYPNGQTVAITYLGNGRTASVTTPQTSRTYTYDENANLKSEALTVGGRTFTTTYAYDGNDALASITLPLTSEVVAYNPDTLGRPTTAGAYVTSITYYSSGNFSEMKFANGYSMKQTETARQWPLSLLAVKTDTSYGYMAKDYQYDGVGNVTQIKDQIDAGRTIQMTYDVNDQLSTANGPWGTASLAYDNVGNIRTYAISSGISNGYTYTNNKLTSTSSHSSIAYDGYGNITNDSKHAFQYDDASNMTCVDCGTGSQITYVYDGNNRRVSRTQNGVTTYYVHIASGDLVTEYTPSASSGIHHIYVGGKRVASHRFTY